MSAQPIYDDLRLEHIERDWSDPEPQPCKWCDSEGVLWLLDGDTEPCPECEGTGVRDDGF